MASGLKISLLPGFKLVIVEDTTDTVAIGLLPKLELVVIVSDVAPSGDPGGREAAERGPSAEGFDNLRGVRAAPGVRGVGGVGGVRPVGGVA